VLWPQCHEFSIYLKNQTVLTNELTKNGFQFISNNLGDDFVDYITTRDRSEILNGDNFLYFWMRAKNVEFKVPSTLHDCLDS